jgi:chromate transport protein ChrA
MLKKIAGICFALSFVMAIVIFGGVGRNYISIYHAKIIFMVSGALGLILNLLTFQTGKHGNLFNFFYWFGSFILFIGLVFLQFRLPYGFYIIVTGIIILGGSFIIPEKKQKKERNNSDLLDD